MASVENPPAVHLPAAALLLDVDGTLIDSTPVVERAAHRWAAEYGLDPQEFLADAHGRRTADRVAEFVPPGRVAEATARLDELEASDTEGVVALPGVLDLLAALDGRPWALVTSMDRPLLDVRRAAAGLPLPEVVVTAEDVRQGKPDPEGYLLAARHLGVAAGECVVIEDAPAGIRAGRAAGARVVAVTTSHPAAALTEADMIVSDLTAVSVTAGGLLVSGNGARG
ncbi:sugar-phosphatase [Thermomonospora echinospora]|uniref:Sugar-phosphatase n=1 Tax=Thermomonospora echinospora TaxID=1992 RepID=A0A1H5SEC0_9ACTN|nr:HAD family hydrolase [Thermomonospora echinospora]SEF48976.1 sugar-phosphatase [Thermomonospora echinospora]